MGYITVLNEIIDIIEKFIEKPFDTKSDKIAKRTAAEAYKIISEQKNESYLNAKSIPDIFQFITSYSVATYMRMRLCTRVWEAYKNGMKLEVAAAEKGGFASPARFRDAFKSCYNCTVSKYDEATCEKKLLQKLHYIDYDDNGVQEKRQGIHEESKEVLVENQSINEEPTESLMTNREIMKKSRKKLRTIREFAKKINQSNNEKDLAALEKNIAEAVKKFENYELMKALYGINTTQAAVVDTLKLENVDLEYAYDLFTQEYADWELDKCTKHDLDLIWLTINFGISRSNAEKFIFSNNENPGYSVTDYDPDSISEFISVLYYLLDEQEMMETDDFGIRLEEEAGLFPYTVNTTKDESGVNFEFELDEHAYKKYRNRLMFDGPNEDKAEEYKLDSALFSLSLYTCLKELWKPTKEDMELQRFAVWCKRIICSFAADEIEDILRNEFHKDKDVWYVMYHGNKARHDAEKLISSLREKNSGYNILEMDGEYIALSAGCVNDLIYTYEEYCKIRDYGKAVCLANLKDDPHVKDISYMLEQ